MTLIEFKNSLLNSAPPATVSSELAALWWARKGDWNRAHGIVQELSTPQAAWVHAYLHRVEGDASNARYWYRQAGQAMLSAM